MSAVMVKPQAGKQELFVASAADIAIYGGAAGGGKSFGLLMEPLRHIRKRTFGGVIFRRTYPQITNEGGLWDTSQELYPLIGGQPRASDLEWRFPSGATIRFAHLQYDKTRLEWQGAQIPYLCVEAGTAVRMGDGSTRAIEDIRVGDKVLTLEGPRRVTRTYAPRVAECVRADVYDEQGAYQGMQIHPINHRVLTVAGWLSYADIECVSRLSSSCGPTQCHEWRISFLQCQTRYGASLRIPCTRQEGLRRRLEQGPLSEDHEQLQGSSVCGPLEGVASGGGTSDGLCLTWQQPGAVSVPVVLHRPSGLLTRSCISEHAQECDNAGAPCGSSPIGSQDHYSACSHPDDVQSPRVQEGDLARPRQRVGAEEDSPTRRRTDGLGRTRRGTPRKLRYDHPYTRDRRWASEHAGIGTLTLTPCGKRMVYDLSVEEVSHYITAVSLINQNCWDELTHFTEAQFWYLLSRNRSMCGVRPYVRGTCNPDPDSWVASLIAWWIDHETGLAIEARAGVLRWFVRVSGEIVWADRKEELERRYPGIPPKSLTFIPASIYDNPKMLEKDPGYIANLEAQPLVDRARLLEGNWKIRPEAGKLFNRSWFEIVNAAPAGGSECRFFDLAATEKEIKGHDPDYTAGVLMRRVGGVYYVLDFVAEQLGPVDADRLMLNTLTQDAARAQEYGARYMLRWEQEGGATGKRDTNHLMQLFAGYDARGVRPRGDKISRAKPLAAQAEAGNVKLVRGPWNEAWLRHMHGQPDLPHDDIMDASSGAFGELSLPTGGIQWL